MAGWSAPCTGAWPRYLGSCCAAPSSPAPASVHVEVPPVSSGASPGTRTRSRRRLRPLLKLPCGGLHERLGLCPLLPPRVEVTPLPSLPCVPQPSWLRGAGAGSTRDHRWAVSEWPGRNRAPPRLPQRPRSLSLLPAQDTGCAVMGLSVFPTQGAPLPEAWPRSWAWPLAGRSWVCVVLVLVPLQGRSRCTCVLQKRA